ncbi:class I SAM-dependent methyltransferase [Actinomyces sp. HMT897]|uniref:class I SAM-dependent methyltransferase n=1 Tax=Actinomyces sp. HMT897 TaxID=2789424 RepID=UPI0028DB2316|nr:class I SAM-dependent methyltransferase [uncultured Actinomyces sp.]
MDVTQDPPRDSGPGPGATPPHPAGQGHGQRTAPEASRMQGHWLLARLGKRVLRPGGIDLTRRMLAAAALAPGERVVELGPGVGRTAELLLARHPSSYHGVDPNPEGRKQVAAVLERHPGAEYVVADAAATGLPAASADLVVGEAMLTIQSDEHKREIVAEAVRLLAPGGRYAIHELALRGDRSPAELEAARKELSRTIRVGARPLPLEAWKDLLTDAGLVVEWTGTAPMHLLEPGRLVQDEGLLGAARFWRNVRRTPGARDRVRAMRQAFQLQGELLSAVGMVARRPQA